MFRNRNHTIVSNFEFPPDFLKTLPPPDKVSIIKKPLQLPTYLNFEEPPPVQNTNQYGYRKFHDVSSPSDFDNISEFDIASFGRSSSSSISFNDEFDTEGTRRVKTELERLDRILQGKEAIPLHFDYDEYEQWMTTFPGVRVYDTTEDSKAQNPESSETNSAPQFKVPANNDVYSSAQHIQQECFNKPLHQNRFDNLLTISPVFLQEPVSRSSYLDTGQQVSNSVYKSAKSASRWMRDERRDYTLLPYLTANGISNKKPHKSSSKLRYSFKAAATSKNISLPPIQTITKPSVTPQYRSVSATPRKVFNETSAISANIDSLKRRRKVVHNKLDSIQSIINYPK